MKIDGHTRVCGLIGDPVEHTSSPAIHNTLSDSMGHNLVYTPFRVEKGKVADAVRGAYELNILGLNVTVPHKIEVMESLVDIDELAERIGAVNTLVRVEGGYKGYNTDILGLERAILEDVDSLEGQTIVILGAGGAARACAFLAHRLNAGKVYILNRTLSRADELATEVNEHAGFSLAYPLQISEYDTIAEKEYAVIQATSIGLSPNDDEAAIEDDSFYSKVSYGFDLVYRPAETKFMKLIKKNSPQAKSSNGLRMLLYQGIIAYELWNKVEVSDALAAQVLKVLEETVRG